MQRTEKNRMKIILKQDINSRQRQDIVPVSNLKARKIKTLLSFPIHLSHHQFSAAAVAPLSLRCRSAVALAFAPAMAPAISPAIAPAVAPLSLLLSLRCCSAVDPLPLLSLHCLCCCPCCCYAIAPNISPSVAPLSFLLSLCCRSAVAPLSLRYQSAVTWVFLRCRCCHYCCLSAVAPAVAPTVTPNVALFFTVVASRGKIWVTVSIGDCQACVSSYL